MAEKKKRVRKQVIADLSVNHLEYHLLKAGHTLHVQSTDYGYDCSISTFSPDGEMENGYVFVQLKATDFMERKATLNGFSVAVSKKDLNLWYEEPVPVYLVLFDAKAELAYWVCIQSYFARNFITPASVKGKSLMVIIDKAHIYGPATPDIWRRHKIGIAKQLHDGVITYE